MFNKQRPPAPKEIASLIGAGSSVTGDVVFTGGLRVDGQVRGSVHCTDGEKGGMLVISEQGAVEGEVRAAHLVVAGRIQGNVYASELVELQPKARVIGDLHYRALEMHHGAVVDGHLVYLGDASRPATTLKLTASGAASEGRSEPKVESAAG